MSLDDEFAVPISATDLNMFALVNVFLGCPPPDIEAKIVRQCSDVNVPLVSFTTSSLDGWIVLVYNKLHTGITRIIYSRKRESRS